VQPGDPVEALVVEQALALVRPLREARRTSHSPPGSTANPNAALATLVYRGGLNFSRADTLSLAAGVGSISTQASVAITVVSIAQQDAYLEAQVSALQAAGMLNQGLVNSLIVKLNLKGNNGDIGKVQAFLNEVAADLNAGILTQAQADALS
jgi:hypothetical protein